MDGGGRTSDDITALGLCVAATNLFQLNFTRLRGGPIGGICCVANAPYASAIRCGCVAIMFFQPVVSVTSVGWLRKKKTGKTIRLEFHMFIMCSFRGWACEP